MQNEASAKLMEAATVLFAAKGYAAVSIRELAKVAGTNSALISYHFGGKEGLYRAVLEKHFQELVEQMSVLRKKNLAPLETISGFASIVIHLHQTHPQLLRLVNSEFITPTACFEQVISKYIEQNFRFLSAAIEEGIRLKQFREDINPAYAAVALASLINFYFIAKPAARLFLPPQSGQDEIYGLQAVDIYLNGIRRN